MNLLTFLPPPLRISKPVHWALQFLFVSLTLLSCKSESDSKNQTPESTAPKVVIREVNQNEIPIGTKIIAIVGATLIDGNGGPALDNAAVIVQGNIITQVGPASSVAVPADAEIVDGQGLTLLPGFIDAHFHLGNDKFPNMFLRRGVTSVRDPGAWIESYSAARESGNPTPRLFLTGPHLDWPPPAYPTNSYLIRDLAEARKAVNLFADQGASGFKVYFRLPLGIIKEVCLEAHKRGLPVTAHLEITNAMDAIEAGLDGIEHVTSFGTTLLPTYEAEQYRQSILADNSARRDGRYEAWSKIDLNDKKVDSLLAFLMERETVVTPTLGAFEYRFGENKTDSIKVKGFQNMMSFVSKAHKAGVKIVAASHAGVPYAKPGWALHHEMILLSECGFPNMEIIVAATMDNARFFRIEERLGSIEEGKLADLVLIEGNPIDDLKVVHNMKKVMLNGIWVPDVETGDGLPR